MARSLPRAGRAAPLLAAAAFAGPALLTLGWLLWSDWTIGNDYPRYPVEAALTLRFYTHLGLEPMWLPHLTGGIPMGGHAIAQAYHLPAWITSLLPGYWTGGALRWLSLRHLLLVAGLHVAWALTLHRGFGLPRMTSYVLGLAAVYNLRTLDLLRHHPGIDAMAYGHGLLLVGLLYLAVPTRAALALVAALAYLLLSCGYPPLLPYLFLAAVMVAGGMAIGPGRWPWTRLVPLSAAATIGALLAAPHWLWFAEWLRVNHRKVAAPTLDWADYLAMAPSGLITNLVAPWAADVTSSFGGMTLVPLLLATLLAASFSYSWRALVVAAFLAFPLVYALGAATPLFRLFFFHVPGFASIRVPGRVFAILPFAALAGWIALRGRPGSRAIGAITAGRRWRRAATAAAVLNAAALAVALARLSRLGGQDVYGYPPAKLDAYWTTDTELAWMALGLASCAAFWAALRFRRGRWVPLVALSLAQAAMTFRHGTWTEPRRPSPTLAEFQAADQLPFYAEAPLVHENGLAEGAYGTASVAYTAFYKAAVAGGNCFLPLDEGEHQRGAVVLPVYLSSSLRCAAGRADALRIVGKTHCRRRSPLRTILTDPGCVDGERDNATQAGLNAGNRLVALTPNGMTLAYETAADAVLVTPYPNMPAHWRAWLDGHPAEIVDVNAGFVGVRAPAGAHTVRVLYRSPGEILGCRIAFVTAMAVAWLALIRFRTPAAVAVLLALTAAGAAGYVRFEKRLVQRAEAQVLLPNHYPELLAAQLERWR